MSALRLSAKLYIVGLTWLAAGALLVAMAGSETPGPRQLVLAAVFGALGVVAWVYPLQFSFKTRLNFDTCVFVAAILLLEPALAIGIIGAGTALAHLILREDGTQALFNTAQAMVQAAAGSLILALGGWTNDPPPFDDPAMVGLACVAGLALLVVTNVAVAAMVGLQSGVGALQIWSQALAGTDRVELLAQGAQIGLGLLAAIVTDAQPWALVLVLVPTGAVYGLLERNLALQRRAEVALRNTEAALAEAQRIAHLGSWEWNVATGEQVWSDQVFALLGFAPQSFVPTYQDFLRYVHPADRAEVDQAVHDALYAGTPFGIDHRMRRPDGVDRMVHQQGEVGLDAQGRKVRVLGTVHDITERIQHERAREEFLAAASHDLKNPLTVIRGQAHLLRARVAREERVDSARLAPGLASIDRAAAEMQGQIDELVDVARLGMGQGLDLQRGPVDLAALVAERTAAHQEASPRHQIRVAEVASRLTGEWDRVRLGRVLDNLLGNAIKYSPDGGEVTVRATRQDDRTGGWALLTVRDQGVGVPATDLPHVFERFHRGTNVGGIAGTGIGLAGAKQIVAQHGGTIAVSSQEGAGSVFTVRLPLAPAPDTARQGVAQEPALGVST